MMGDLLNIMPRKNPKPSEKWIHYKRKNSNGYDIIGLARCSIIYFDTEEMQVICGDLIEVLFEVARHYDFVVQQVDTDELFVAGLESNEWIIRPAINPITHEKTKRKAIAWIRTLSDFMDSVVLTYSPFFR